MAPSSAPPGDDAPPHKHHSATKKRSNGFSTLFHSMAWYLMLSAIAFFWGAYRSVMQLQLQMQSQNHVQSQLPFNAPIFPGSSRLKNAPNKKLINSSSNPLQIDPDYSLAYHQSYGFFNDIPNQEWERIRTIAKQAGLFEPRPPPPAADQFQNAFDDDDTYWNLMPTRIFYGRNYDPNFSCREEVRVGGMGDGPKFVCDPRRIPRVASLGWREWNGDREVVGERLGGGIDSASDAKCLVYSIGSGGNFRFETGLQAFIGPEHRCEIHVFDATDYSSFVPLNMDIHFHPWGLRKDHGPNTNDDFSPDENVAYPLMNKEARDSTLKYISLPQILKKLNHEGRIIDILKIDCEGCEWLAYPDWTRGTSFDETMVIPPPRQVLLEVHNSPNPYARRFFKVMREAGYVIFHKEPNLEGCRGDCVEYGFLKLRPDFYS